MEFPTAGLNTSRSFSYFSRKKYLVHTGLFCSLSCGQHTGKFVASLHVEALNLDINFHQMEVLWKGQRQSRSSGKESNSSL